MDNKKENNVTIERWSTYLLAANLTFVMLDKMQNGKLIYTECIGFYNGEPDAEYEQNNNLSFLYKY